MPILTNANRVKETTTTTGTGTYSLAGAATGYRGFVAGCGDQSLVSYTATNGTDWEVGIGRITDAGTDTLSRMIILSSSNAGAAVSWSAGTKDIFVTPVAELDQLSGPRSMYYYFDDCMNTISAQGNGVLVNTLSGTGAQTAAQTNNVVGRVGLVRSSTGVATTGRSAPTTGIAIKFSGASWFFEMDVNITTLSTVGEEFAFVCGFFDAFTASTQTDAACFLYDRLPSATGATAATYWQTLTAQNGSRTYNTSLTQTTVNAGQWYRLRIEVNAGATSVAFYIDGVLVSTHTGNIPGSGRDLGFGWLIVKSAGTTARTADIDFIEVLGIQTTAR